MSAIDNELVGCITNIDAELLHTYRPSTYRREKRAMADAVTFGSRPVQLELLNVPAAAVQPKPIPKRVKTVEEPPANRPATSAEVIAIVRPRGPRRNFDAAGAARRLSELGWRKRGAA